MMMIAVRAVPARIIAVIMFMIVMSFAACPPGAP
jgi:hypothetical protein